MKGITTALLIIALAVAPVAAHEKCDKADCAELREKIRTIESRMRAGYTRAQGERYKAKLRELKARRRKVCR